LLLRAAGREAAELADRRAVGGRERRRRRERSDIHSADRGAESLDDALLILGLEPGVEGQRE
jgi:hypothetical protein